MESPGDPAPDQQVIDRIRLLMERAGTTRYSDVIGFRRLAGQDLGVPQSLPRTEAAARWMAARYLAARDALGQEFLLQPASCSIATPCSGSSHGAFLRRVASLAECDLLLDVTDLTRDTTEEGADPAVMLSGLPHENVAMLATSGADEAEWAFLSRLVALTTARAIVIRRTRDLFPLDAIMETAHRARSVLTQKRQPVAEDRLGSDPLDDDPDGLERLRSHQSELIDFCRNPESAPPEATRLATRLRSWQVWRDRIADTHKARQIAQFLAEDAGHDARRRG